jgi:hypothetical protein
LHRERLTVAVGADTAEEAVGIPEAVEAAVSIWEVAGIPEAVEALVSIWEVAGIPEAAVST